MAVAANELIDVRQLMRTVPLGELNRAADEYFKQAPDWDNFLAKPLADLGEMPVVLSGFALVVDGLKLCRGMTVLDFGAGACWCAHFLTQLGCKAIAADVSPTALEIGRERFRRIPVVGRCFEPRFVVFDGLRLDLAGESVDRVICLAAFHHVPNQAQVLSELARVLKPGGVAGFHEPGPTHSSTGQAQLEMRNFKVVENDIVMEEIWPLAQAAGFTDLKLAFHGPILSLVPLDEYNQFLQPGAHNARLLEETKLYLRGQRMFFLSKGPPAVPDSRQHFGLVADLEVELAARSVRAGTPLRGRARVKNVGTTLWLPSDAEVGPVRLGARGLDAAGKRQEFTRHALPNANGDGIRPGEEVTFEFEMPPLGGPGRYRLEFDLVSELVCWFSINGSPIRTIDVQVL
jgi:SAM-dependent methyltransferase